MLVFHKLYYINELDEGFNGKEFRHDKITTLVLCFRNIIEIIQSEIFLSLKQILEISIRIINDNNDAINSKSIEIESIIKNKIGIYFDNEQENDQGGK